MNNIGKSVDDNVSKRIIDALSTLDENSIDRLAKESCIPLRRLHSLIDNTEQLTMLDKGVLIPHLITLLDQTDKQK